ncbi:MAG: hypothetical protein QXR53_00330 [Candidatus Norongarragalinales archaeon]
MEFSKAMALRCTLVLGVAGMLFSGYLSFGELFGVGAGGSCPAASAAILGVPTCVYGFVMYAIITIVSLAGLTARE